jgi:hypothetical protein
VGGRRSLGCLQRPARTRSNELPRELRQAPTEDDARGGPLRLWRREMRGPSGGVPKPTLHPVKVNRQDQDGPHRRGATVGEAGLRKHHPRSATPATFGLCTASVSWGSLRCTGANETLMSLMLCEFCCAGMIPRGGAYLWCRRYGWPCSGDEGPRGPGTGCADRGHRVRGLWRARAECPKRRDAPSPGSLPRRRRCGDPGHVRKDLDVA